MQPPPQHTHARVRVAQCSGRVETASFRHLLWFALFNIRPVRPESLALHMLCCICCGALLQDPASDYSWWVPRGNLEKCYMGRVEKYAIKKDTSVCWDPAGTMRVMEVSNCSCTWDDYECDYGYYEGLAHDGTPECKRVCALPLPWWAAKTLGQVQGGH